MQQPCLRVLPGREKEMIGMFVIFLVCVTNLWKMEGDPKLKFEYFLDFNY